MRDVLTRWIVKIRQTYWFWPSVMTVAALIIGIALPSLDAHLGSGWLRDLGFVRATGVDGARAILTTLAGATLGVAGVAFSVTIVAVSFASANYGPRLIGNFMADRKNQIVLGIFVATFVYCITVLSTVHASPTAPGATLDAFVPQLSVFFALFLCLGAVGALIFYIHHIPESINIMNLTAEIGHKLQHAITAMLDAEDRRCSTSPDPVDVNAARARPRPGTDLILRAETAGFLQLFDMDALAACAQRHQTQITLHRAVGDFVVVGDAILSLRRNAECADGDDDAGTIAPALRSSFSLGANRTDAQDVLFLSDQLVEVLARALSPGVNDPQTAMLCLDWLQAGLVVFARRPPAPQAQADDPVLYRRLGFEAMLDRCFDEMRQYVAGDRNTTLHALRCLTRIAMAASHDQMARACLSQMQRLAGSADALLSDPFARAEIEAEMARAARSIASARGAWA